MTRDVTNTVFLMLRRLTGDLNATDDVEREFALMATIIKSYTHTRLDVTAHYLRCTSLSMVAGVQGLIHFSINPKRLFIEVGLLRD